VKQVLFDENMPRKLRRDLAPHEIRTVQEEGWSGSKNGELLRRMADRFEVLVTIDQRMRFQQNLKQFSVVVIEVPDTRLRFLRELASRLRDAIDRVEAGEVIVVRPA